MVSDRSPLLAAWPQTPPPAFVSCCGFNPHLLMASTSSVYGANEDMPFSETQKADTPLTIYAATKKANEMMGHSYAHLWDLGIA